MNENQFSKQEKPNVSISPNDMQSTSDTVTNNLTSTFVPPIAEVKVDASSDSVITSEPQKLEETSNEKESFSGNNISSANQPTQNSKISTILLILLFIFLFVFIMGMPYINDFIHGLKKSAGLSEIEREAKEEEERQRQEEENNQSMVVPEEETVNELVCTSLENENENFKLVVTQNFYYNTKNQVLNSKISFQYDFAVIDESYYSLKQQCDEDSLKYLTHDGYTVACSYGENHIEMSREFDLKTFTPIVDGTTNIQANATYLQNLGVLKTNLINQGYTCK